MTAALLRTSVRFGTVGVVNTLLSIAVIFSLKAFAGAHDLPANAAGYAVGLTCSFALNRNWTFQHEGRLLPALARFLSVFAVAYLFNIAVVFALIGAGFNDYLAHLAGMPVYTVVFYLGCLGFAFPQAAGAQAQERAPPAPLRLALPLLACTALLAIAALKLHPAWEPLRGNDSYQYLSIGDNFRHGLFGKTSLLHFDEERMSGAIPAPITTFPIGYPLLVGAAEAPGLSVERAALLISLLAALACVFVLDAIGRRLGLTVTARAWVLAAFVASSWTPLFAISALTEAIFTLAILAGLALLLAALDVPEKHRARFGVALAAGMLLGLSYWLRYAGLFVLLALLPVAALAWAMKRRDAAANALIAFFAGALIVAGGMLRNIALMGSWRGGNTKTIENSMGHIAHEFAIAIRDLLFGEPRMSEWLVLRGLLLAAIVIACIAGVAFYLKRPRGEPPADGSVKLAAGALLAVIVSYVSALTYAAAHTGISYGARYFYPMLPLAALLVGVAIAWTEQGIRDAGSRSRWRAAVAGVAAAYALLHVTLFLQEQPPAPHDYVAKRLDTRISKDLTARQAVLSRTGADDVIMANVGQATGYVLHRPTISLIGAHLGAREWNEAAVRETMRRFGVKLLVIYTPGPDDAVIPYPSAFIERLAKGDAPGWLHRIGASDAVILYSPAS